MRYTNLKSPFPPPSNNTTARFVWVLSGLTWQKQLWSWLSEARFGRSTCCVWGLASLCWNQPRTKFPKNQASSKTQNACKVAFHIPRRAAGALVGGTKQETRRNRDDLCRLDPHTGAVWWLVVAGYDSFGLAEVSIRRLVVAMNRRTRSVTRRVPGSETLTRSRRPQSSRTETGSVFTDGTHISSPASIPPTLSRSRFANTPNFRLQPSN